MSLKQNLIPILFGVIMFFPWSMPLAMNVIFIVACGIVAFVLSRIFFIAKQYDFGYFCIGFGIHSLFTSFCMYLFEITLNERSWLSGILAFSALVGIDILNESIVMKTILKYMYEFHPISFIKTQKEKYKRNRYWQDDRHKR